MTYDETIEINLSELNCLVACPYQPDNVKTVKELEGTKVNQVLIGSCTNSSYEDMVKVASILKGKNMGVAQSQTRLKRLSSSSSSI